jgi:heme exporter protein A
MQCVAGEIVGLLGPNGAGKSTLLAVVSTLLEPSSGEVLYGAHTARTAGSALRARLGLLAHDLHLYGELSARENLMFFASLYGVKDRSRRVDEALERAALLDRGGDPVSSFSRGMRQRLALERALLHDPRLLLLDEPFTGLDDQSAAALALRLSALREEQRIILLATHDLEVADRLIDRAVILRDGRVVTVEETGRPLRERYRKALGTVPREGVRATS